MRTLPALLLPLLLPLLPACDGGKDSGADPDDTGTDADDSATADDSGADDSATVIDDTGGTDDSAPDSDDSGDAIAYADLFDASRIHTVVIEVDDADLAALAADPEVYVPVAATVDGVAFAEVGLRLVGNTDDHALTAGKPSLRLKLDEYDGGLDYGDVSRITLDAMNGDPSQSRAVLAAWLLEQAGVPAARAAYASVDYVLNGQTVHLGLYANVETLDGDFADHHYVDGGGDLWEAHSAADFTDAGVQRFELKSGDGTWMNLDAAWSTIWSGAADQFYGTADTVLQMDGFVQYWAWRIALGAYDGYPYELDDYSIYADPSAEGRLAFIPDDLEKTWGWDPAVDVGWDEVSGVVAYKCLLDLDCEDALMDAAGDALDAYDDAEVDLKASELFILSEEELSYDDRRAYTIGEVSSARTQLTARLATWADRVRVEMGL